MQFQNLCTDSELPFSLKIAQKDIILIFYHFYDFFLWLQPFLRHVTSGRQKEEVSTFLLSNIHFGKNHSVSCSTTCHNVMGPIWL